MDINAAMWERQAVMTPSLNATRGPIDRHRWDQQFQMMGTEGANMPRGEDIGAATDRRPASFGEMSCKQDSNRCRDDNQPDLTGLGRSFQATAARMIPESTLLVAKETAAKEHERDKQRDKANRVTEFEAA